MCIIAIKQPDLPMIPDDTIRYMFARNRDGAGVMWTLDNKVHIRKGFMTVDSYLDFLHSREWSGIPVILHMRIGTSGLNNAENCHPYPIRKKNFTAGTCDLAMAHNGVLHEYTPPRGSIINDTQVFINDVINQLPKKFLENKAIRKLLGTEIGSNRIVFLDKEGKITKFGSWVTDENGYVYSNSGYKPYTPVRNSFSMRYPGTTTKATRLPPLQFKWNFDSEEAERPDLSFINRFVAKGSGKRVMELTSEKEADDVLKELEQKLTMLDENYFTTETYDFDYEFSRENGCVTEYSTAL